MKLRRVRGMTFVEIIVVIAIALGIALAVLAMAHRYGKKVKDTEAEMNTTVDKVPEN